MDKQIIDEERMFECVWCKYDFKESDANFILSENPNECVCSGCITEWADNLLCDLKRKEQECEELLKFNNSLVEEHKTIGNDLYKEIKEYRKKLKAKEQECERLKHDNGYEVGALEKTIDQLKAENDELKKQRQADKGLITSTGKQNYQLIQEYDKLKTALTEIKEIVSHCIKQNICTTCDNSEKCHIEDEEIPTYDVCKLILQKISEVEDV